MVMIIYGDCRDKLKELEAKSVQMCVTSPPYWGLRDYGHNDQIGLEKTPEEYTANMVSVFRQVKRVMKDDGTLWLNLGDSYAGNNSRASTGGSAGYGTKREGVFNNLSGNLKQKDLVGIPWRVAFALQADGWYLRQDIIWHKPNPMPESVTDRCTKSHEYIFLLTKSPKYYFDNHAISEEANYQGVMRGGSTSRYEQNNFGGDNKEYDRRNKRSVWSVKPATFKESHFAVFPQELIEPCIQAGSKVGDIVIDPFFGSGTTGEVAQRFGRDYIGIELNEDYKSLQQKRCGQMGLGF